MSRESLSNNNKTSQKNNLNENARVDKPGEGTLPRLVIQFSKK